MFTTIDKAIAAVIGGLASFAFMKWGIQLEWLTPEVINTLSVLISGMLVYIVPNKPKV